MFAVTQDTITTWLRRTDEEGDRALVQTSEPVNKFPSYVSYLVRWLKARTFKAWCRRRSVRPRFGAVGKHASIAILERFIRSMKAECTRRLLVPLRFDEMRDELSCYATWYNDHRPHQALGGRTPTEIYVGSETRARTIEPRARWPVEGDQTPAQHIRLLVKFVEGRRHLPVVELKRVA